MKKKYLLGLLSVAAIGLVACGNKSDDSTGKEAEPYTISVMTYGDASTEEVEKVSAALSKITKEKIGAEIKLTRVGFGSYGDQLNLALSSNEKLDAFVTLGQSTTELADKGQIVPLNDLLDNEGKDIKSGIPEADLKTTAVGEDIYGFPTVKEKATNYGYTVLQSAADEAGIKEGDITSLDDLEPALEKLKAAFPDKYPISMDFTNVYMPTTVDDLGNGLGVLEDVLTDSTKVVNWYNTDTYKNFVTKMYDWAQKGYVQPDGANNSEGRVSLIKSGKVLGGFQGFNPGNVAGWEKDLGQKLAAFQITEPFSITGHVAGVVWCIANNSDNPEKTMEFLNLAYTDPEVSNLLINGIEGEDYVFTDDSKETITFPDGVDGSTTKYMRLPWSWPNATIAYTWEGEDPNQWEVLNEYNESAHPSIAKGFRFDSESVMNEITACQNVTAKYDTALQCGVLNPETTLEKFNKELEDAGIDVVIKEKQKQLDEWLAAQ